MKTTTRTPLTITPFDPLPLVEALHPDTNRLIRHPLGADRLRRRAPTCPDSVHSSAVRLRTDGVPSGLR